MEERKGFRSNFGFLMAAIGSAVGLGNIWGFPFKMGKGGGFAFLLLYLLLTALCGFVLLLSELALGRRAGSNAVSAYAAVSKRFRWVGQLTPVTSVLILAFYSALGGYCLKYLVLHIGDLLGASWGGGGMSGAAVFAELMSNQTESVLYGMVFLLINLLIVAGGVSGGIERFCSVGMPALFVMLLIVIVRSCTLPGAAAGLRFMFAPNFAPLREDFLGVLKTAGGQVFFSLSLASGAMITYGSYTDRRQSLPKNTAVIAFCGAFVGLLAGMAVLPAAFSTGAPESAMGGPELLFVTLQDVFEKMGVAGPLFGVLFYALVTLAAVSSSVSLLEVPVAFLTDRSRLRCGQARRGRYAAAVTALTAVLCAVTCADGLGSNGLWVPFQSLFGGDRPFFCESWLNFLDMIAEGILMPVGGLFTCLMIGWELGPASIRAEVECQGNRFRTYRFYRFCIRFVTPLIMLFILWGQIRDFFCA